MKNDNYSDEGRQTNENNTLKIKSTRATPISVRVYKSTRATPISVRVYKSTLERVNSFCIL